MYLFEFFFNILHNNYKEANVWGLETVIYLVFTGYFLGELSWVSDHVKCQ